MAIGSQFLGSPPPEFPLNLQTLPPLPSPSRTKVKKTSFLYSPDFEKKRVGSKKQQRLSNLAELMKNGCENIDFDPFHFRHNPFEGLTEETLHNSPHDLAISSCKESVEGQYRLCRHEKEIKAMVKRNKFGYELVSKVELSLVDLISLKKPGQLSICLKDSFERLLIHILCRYYRLNSLSITDAQGKIFLASYDGKSEIPSEPFTDIFYK